MSVHGHQQDRVRWVLAALVTLDVLFIVLHVAASLTGWTRTMWSIESDGGYAERYQYLKELACCLLLLSCWRHAALRGVAFAWLLLMGFILLDDAMGWHELYGRRVSEGAMAWGYSVSPSQGELMFLLCVGLLVAPGLALATWRADARGRAVSAAMAVLIGLFAFFAVVVDYVHAQVTHPVLHPVLGLVEDGAEMFSISLLCWFLLLIATGRSFPGAMRLIRSPALRWHAASREQNQRVNG